MSTQFVDLHLFIPLSIRVCGIAIVLVLFVCFPIASSAQSDYSTGNIATPIPSSGTVEIPLNVPDTFTIADVNASIRLNHTFDGDLDIFLVHPDGTVVELSSDNGASGDNYGAGANDCSGTPTTFDDAAATSITLGAAPFAGTFRPETLLSDLNGKPSNGTWLLRIIDDTTGDVGTVGCFSLQFARMSPTAATVSISGQVTTSSGDAIMNVRLSLTDSQGNVRTAVTDSSGNYRFDDVQAGETYILTATGKRYSFSQPVQVLNINEETNQVNFIANSEKRLRVF